VNDSNCKFCRIVSGTDSGEIVFEDEWTLAFLDIRPLFPGHTLAVPKLHAQTLGDVPAELLERLFKTVQILSRAVPLAMNAEGTFVAVNNIVSQSAPHLHVHVVPRTKGDGLRGFFWPRQKYTSQNHLHETRSRIEQAIMEVIEMERNSGRIS